ncbi:MAG TPA: hypothetical protein VJR92_03315 [Gemmatimonadaceae bacterium]|nr:hypothetical protein [Gemmatimonadaceae bacterium]
MTRLTGSHAPTPEFRAALEQEIVDAFRREEQFASTSKWALRGPRLRTAMAMAAGMLLAVSTQFAAGQVQDARQRDSLAAVLEAKQVLTKLRLELARQDATRAQESFNAGVITRETLQAAQSELRVLEASLARLQLDVEEVRASAVSPRDELWAPLVGSRDFVKERIALDAAVAEAKLRSAESAAAETERQVRVGILTRAAAEEARARVADATSDLELIAERTKLRDEFLREHLAPEEVARRLDRLQMNRALRRAALQLQRAVERLKLVRERRDVGVTAELEVKRAELDALQLQLELERLQRQLDALGASIRR